MDTVLFFIYLAVMAGVTYLIRAIPFVLCKGEVKNVFIRSFLTYVPYAVLGAMTFPAILFSTNGLVSAIAGTIVALVLAFSKKGLASQRCRWAWCSDRTFDCCGRCECSRFYCQDGRNVYYMINLMRSADKNSFLCIKQVEKWLIKQMGKYQQAVDKFHYV